MVMKAKDVKGKVFVIGLDSAPPELLFYEFIDEMPNIKKLIKNSIYGSMKSCIPAITIPAWTVMTTGKTPGELGLYGFRHRKNGSYKDIWIANSKKVTEPHIWDYISEKKSILVGIPPSYPPRKINGWLISCFITPDNSVNYTYPEGLKREVESLVGEYIFDVIFRKEERDELIEEIWEMTQKRFEVIRYLIENKDWDYFQFVEIGLDRVHHAFWKYFDKDHHLYEHSKYSNVIRDYYKLLDKEIGKTLKLLEDDTAIIIISDHGVKRMKGAFAINQWLIEEGYLKIRDGKELRKGVRLDELSIDWRSTIAWAWGGYYARIFLNVKGREKDGVVKASEYDSIRDEIRDAVKSIRGPNGERWDTKVFYPEEIYPVALGDKPDIMVYLDNLSWRSAGTLGHESNYLPENDTGPDDAVHSEYGVFIMHLPDSYSDNCTRDRERGLVDVSIYDFAPTVLKLFDVYVPMRGKSIIC